MENEILNDFTKWLQLKYKNSNMIVEILIKLNDFSIKQKYSKHSFWEINTIKELEKVISRIKKSKIHKDIFDKIFNLYLEFLHIREQNKKDEIQEFIVDFNSLETSEYSYTQPTKLIIDKKTEVVHNWVDLLLKVCEELIAYNPQKMKDILKEQPFPKARKLYFNDKNEKLIHGHLLSNGIWIETNFNSNQIVNLCKILCEKCNFNLDKIVIYYFIKELLKYENVKLSNKPNYVKSPDTYKLTIMNEIEQVLLESNEPLDVENIKKRLNHIPVNKILQVLSTDDKIIYEKKNFYSHVNKFEVTEDDKKTIEKIIREELKEDFISIKQLLEKLKLVFPEFINKNNICTNMCLRDILKYYFEKDFSFQLAFIGKSEQKMSAVIVVNKYLQNKENFTLTELTKFVQDNNLPLTYNYFINEAKNNFIRINKENFIRKEKINFNIYEIEKAISKYIVNEYVPINQIKNYSKFPNINIEWNEFLLENLIDSYSTKYKILNDSQSIIKIIGVIVQKRSTFKNYESILADVIVKNKLNINNQRLVIEYLFSNGFLAQKKLKNYKVIVKLIKQLTYNSVYPHM